jgi:tetratricopeptide (TPR) repeat protein
VVRILHLEAERWRYIKRVAGDAFRRHRIGFAAAAVVLLGGISVAVWQARVASVERAEAVQRISQVREDARSVLSGYHEQIAALPGATAARERLVQEALRYIDQLAQEAAGDPELMRDRAEAYERIATLQGSSDLTTSGTTPTENHGDPAGAEATQQKAVALREELLGKAGTEADRLALAKAWNKLGELYVDSGSPEKAFGHLQNAISILESMLGSAASEEVRSLLGTAYLTIGKAYGSPGEPNLGGTRTALAYIRGALKMQQELAAAFPSKPEYLQRQAATHHALGLIYAAIGEREEELEQNSKAVEVGRKIVAAQPDNPILPARAGGAAWKPGHAADAGKRHRQRAGAFPRGLGDLPQSRRSGSARRWGAAAVGGGTSQRRGGGRCEQFCEAEQHFEKALNILSEIVAKDPKNTDFRRQCAFTHLAKSRFQLEVDPEAAVVSAQEGIRIGEELAAASPADVAVQRTFAQLLTQLGAAHAKAAAARPERWSDAKSAYARALTVYENLKAGGKLSGADARKPEELAAEISKCDAAISARQASAR